MSIKTKRVVTAIMAAVLVLAMLLGVITPVFADELDDLEAQQQQLEEEAAQAEALKNATAEELEEAENAVNAMIAEIQELNAEISEVGDRIIELNQKIDENEVKLQEKEAELAQAQEDLKVYYAALKGRIQMMYESDRSSYLDILLSASSVSDFFSKLEYISEMVEYDNHIMEELDACRERIQESKEAIEETKAALEADRAKEQEEQDALLAIAEEKQAKLEELESNELMLSVMVAEQEAAHADLVARLSDTQAEIEAEYQRIAAEEEARRQAEEEAKRQQEEQQKQQEEQTAGDESYEDEETDNNEEDDDNEYESYDPSTAPEEGDSSDESGRVLSNGYWSSWPGIGNGMLGWPVDCYTLSSLFGPRIHPVTGEYKNHGGIDICADYGQSIYSCGSGVVLEADGGGNWNGGWGNYVMIQHDNGLQTVYAHCSSVNVVAGQRVSQGEVIGWVGSTGMSTGPHLHLEVWSNGCKVDPEDYL